MLLDEFGRQIRRADDPFISPSWVGAEMRKLLRSDLEQMKRMETQHRISELRQSAGADARETVIGNTVTVKLPTRMGVDRG